VNASNLQHRHAETSPFDQSPFPIKFEWGPEGLKATAGSTDVFIIVDVLSFSTSVSVAVDRGGLIYPFPWNDVRAQELARQIGGELAGRRGSGSRFSLSPASLRRISPGESVVLPSPNGSQLSTLTNGITTIAGCFRNARVTALAAEQFGRRITVIAAGERWEEGNTLRPSVEDALGAGAILSHLSGVRSPEATAAEATYLHRKNEIAGLVMMSSSGRELIAQGYEEDVQLALEMNSQQSVAVLKNGRYAAV